MTRRWTVWSFVIVWDVWHLFSRGYAGSPHPGAGSGWSSTAFAFLQKKKKDETNVWCQSRGHKKNTLRAKWFQIILGESSGNYPSSTSDVPNNSDHRLRVGTAEQLRWLKAAMIEKKHVLVMNLNFAKVQSVFPLDPISASALFTLSPNNKCTHMRECAALSPDHPDGNVSKRRVAIIITDSLSFAAPSLCS